MDPIDDTDAPDDVVPSEQAAWQVDDDGDGGWAIVMPNRAKMAAVVDGQHRLFAFAKDAAASNLDVPLICSIDFDLPKPFQAQPFAT